MIQPHHEPEYQRLHRIAGFRSPMLMLGHQLSAVPNYPMARDYFRQWADDYTDLDTDGGDLKVDLNYPYTFEREYVTVFNLGTLEHVWNQHAAWETVLRAVAVGGYFMSVGPADGWVGHGLHMTWPPTILALLTTNGFEVIEHWTTRWRTQGPVLWVAARKIDTLVTLTPVYQIYEDGKKIGIR